MRRPMATLLEDAMLLPLPLPLAGEGWGEGFGRLIQRCAWCDPGAGMSPRQASHFLLLRQKKVTKEKATPLAASLRFAPGSLRCSLFAGSAQTRFAQTRAALIREKLRSSATARGELEFNAPWRVLVWGARAHALRVLARAAKKVTRPPGRHPGSCTQTSATPNRAPKTLTPALSRKREREREQHLITAAPITKLAL
jgi:hypothetical protein